MSHRRSLKPVRHTLKKYGTVASMNYRKKQEVYIQKRQYFLNEYGERKEYDSAKSGLYKPYPYLPYIGKKEYDSTKNR